MKPKFLLAPLAFAFLYCGAETIRFSYDSSGNRIKRQIVMSTQKAPKTAGNEELMDFVSDKTIKIMPNPTKGDLKITINNYEAGDTGAVYLFSLSGQTIAYKDFADESVELDITGQPNGLYILKVVLNGENTTWKIVKE